MTTLFVEGVSKRFGGVVAAERVSMQVPAGKIVGLIGPNGAGKTTLVNLIGGVLAPSEGRIRLDDIDLTSASSAGVGRVGIARTFQNIRLLKESTVLDNVLIGSCRHQTSSLVAALLGLPSANRETEVHRERARERLRQFQMEEYSDLLPSELSYGHQRRLDILRALASEPSVLLLDEPVAGMNDIEAAELGDVFKGLAKAGYAMLLIEHNMTFVSELCDYVYVLDSGRLIAEGTPDEVISNPAVISAYLGS